MDSINDILLSAGFSFEGNSGSAAFPYRNGYNEQDICFKYIIELMDPKKFPGWAIRLVEFIDDFPVFIPNKQTRNVISCDIEYKNSIIKDDNAEIRLCYVGIYDSFISLDQFKSIFSDEYVNYRDVRIKEVLK